MRQAKLNSLVVITLLLGCVGCDDIGNFEKGMEAANKGDYETALREWTLVAESEGFSSLLYSKNDVLLAQHNLGMMYTFGHGVSKNYKTALKWHKLAAEQGNPFSQNSLGQMYEKGVGVSQDYKVASKWYELAANQGNAFSQNRLGQMYEAGIGVS